MSFEKFPIATSRHYPNGISVSLDLSSAVVVDDVLSGYHVAKIQATVLDEQDQPLPGQPEDFYFIVVSKTDLIKHPLAGRIEIEGGTYSIPLIKKLWRSPSPGHQDLSSEERIHVFIPVSTISPILEKLNENL